MKKYTLVGILGALILVLLLVVFYLLWQFHAYSGVLPHFVVDDTNQSVKIGDKELTWQEELAQWPTANFTPAAESFSLHFDADTSELKEKSRYFQIVINKNDVYSMFCLRRVLDSSGVKYFLLKSGEDPEVFLDTGNERVIEGIIEALKRQKISIKVKEIWL